MATIERRGKNRYRVQIRRHGTITTRTFDTRKAAQDWVAVTEGKTTGRTYQDTRPAEHANLFQALAWFADQIAPPDAQGWPRPRSHWTCCQIAYVHYWEASDFALWSVLSRKSWDLIAWRRYVLDEDDAEPRSVSRNGSEARPRGGRRNTMPASLTTLTVVAKPAPASAKPAPRLQDRLLVRPAITDFEAQLIRTSLEELCNV